MEKLEFVVITSLHVFFFFLLKVFKTIVFLSFVKTLKLRHAPETTPKLIFFCQAFSKKHIGRLMVDKKKAYFILVVLIFIAYFFVAET